MEGGGTGEKELKRKGKDSENGKGEMKKKEEGEKEEEGAEGEYGVQKTSQGERPIKVSASRWILEIRFFRPWPIPTVSRFIN